MKKPALPPLRSGAALFTCACLIITPASAELRTFVIDPTQSSLQLQGSALGIAVEEQADGSLTTTYAGTILADVTETTVAFVGGSEITANNSGSWQPAAGGAPGNAPANYGAQATVLGQPATAALRNLEFDVTGEATALLGGTFAADGLTFAIPPTSSAAADYSAGFFVGSEGLAGQGGNNVGEAGNLAVVGDELVLTIAVDYVLAVDDIQGQFRIFGQLVAKAPNEVPLTIPDPVVTPGQLSFNLPTIIGKTYTILGSADLGVPLENWNVIDQFEATSTSEARDIAIALAGQQFFILRVDD
jgi:hypothetical protein